MLVPAPSSPGSIVSMRGLGLVIAPGTCAALLLECSLLLWVAGFAEWF